MIEQGLPSVEAINWYGLLVPSKTPREGVNRFNGAVVKSLCDRNLREKLVARAPS